MDRSKATPRPKVGSQTGERLSAIPALTGLRFFAAVWVVLHHWGIWLVAFPPIVRLYPQQGKAGVSLFFVVSGFVLVYNYYPHFSAGLGGYASFIQARLARIYPLYLLGLILLTPVTLTFLNSQAIHSTLSRMALAISWLSNLMMLQAWIPNDTFSRIWNGASWSISDEIAFYLLLPFFIYLVLSRITALRSLITLLVLLWIVQVVLVVGTAIAVEKTRFLAENNLLYKNPLYRVWEFLLGATLARILLSQRKQLLDWNDRLPHRSVFRNVPVSLSLLILLVLPPLLARASSRLPFLSAEDNYVIFTPVFGLLILGLALRTSFIAPLIESRLVVRLGEASYSLYMVHWLPLTALRLLAERGHRAPTAPWLAINAAVICLTVCASLWLYQHVEAPARRTLRPRPGAGEGHVKLLPP
ncbi:MAG: acyltransferase family protein [Dehalococcoidia bacterium]